MPTATPILMTDPTLLAKFRNNSGRLQKIIKSKMSDEQKLEELFLATLSRLPNDRDKKAFTDYLERVPDRPQALTDTMWALINTREFILNH